MKYVLLIRGGASDDAIIWMMIIALAGLLLAGQWLSHKIMLWVQNRRMQHLWPFR